MKLPAIALSAVLLSGCATSATTVHEDLGKALIAAETTADAAVLAADVAVKARLTSPAQNAQIVKLAGQVQADVAIGRQAYAASDQTNTLAMTAALGALAAQLNGAHP